ncbi:hypothetical protein V5799_003348 [Amblyomma americanum]|uniref:tRNA-specific 2-thiouridylase MnmA-like C-terminal domain-containing protein n=1 Tax=Amblyomma americanum TaxID=6943 RepID=A0AAQ4D980_AMBAM
MTVHLCAWGHWQVPGQHHPALYWRTLYTGKPHWICREPPWCSAGSAAPSLRCLFRTQHRNDLAWCTVHPEESKGCNRLRVHLDDYHRAIAIGQFIVMYGTDGECYGSAKILGVGPSLYEEQRHQDECLSHHASSGGR